MSDGRELTRLVILDGQTWPAGSVPPAEVAARITNPKCWAAVEGEPGLPWNPEGAPASTEYTNLITPGGTPPEQSGSKVVEEDPPHDPPAPNDRPEATSTPPQALLSEPPRAGKGASASAWLAYARQLNVVVDADTSRDEIIALLKDDGHIQ